MPTQKRSVKTARQEPPPKKRQLVAPFTNPLQAPLVRPKVKEQDWGKTIECVEAEPGFLGEVNLRGDIVSLSTTPNTKPTSLAFAPKTTTSVPKNLTPAQFNAYRMQVYDTLVRKEKERCDELRAQKRAEKVSSRQLKTKTSRSTTPAKRKPVAKKQPLKPIAKVVLKPKPKVVEVKEEEEEEDEEEDEEEEEDEAPEDEEEEEAPKTTVYDGEEDDDLAPSAGEDEEEEDDGDGDEEEEVADDPTFGDDWQGNDDDGYMDDGGGDWD